MFRKARLIYNTKVYKIIKVVRKNVKDLFDMTQVCKELVVNGPIYLGCVRD